MNPDCSRPSRACLPANPALAGLKAYAQFLFADSCATGGVAASNAVEIEILP